MGIGAEASAGFTKDDDDGAYHLRAKLGGALGVGGGVHLDLKVDPEKIVDSLNPFD